jgi:Protein of unknown function (DUF2794)
MGIQDFTGAFSPKPGASTEAVPVRGPVFFDRKELDAILRLYGRKVAAGEWRDYGIDAGTEAAIFFIFRRTGEAPVYRIEKRPSLSRKQGAFCVFNQNGMALKRGRELGPILGVMDKTRFDVL